ncbi:MAG: hypothetical protein ISP90_07630 [Nevskia sp.]|nr:hypothetical protein [Nevskia sp.]
MKNTPPRPWPRPKWTTVVPVALVALGLGLVGFSTLLEWRAGVAYRRVQLGDAESKVMLFLGRPARYEPCGDPLWWDDRDLGKNDGRCLRYARYDYHHSSYAIGYSADHVVVSKHHYVTD